MEGFAESFIWDEKERSNQSNMFSLHFSKLGAIIYIFVKNR